jgi:adenosine deaminase
MAQKIQTDQVSQDKMLWDWAHNLPKIDLHRHLEGSLRVETLTEIAQEHGIELPSYDVEKLRPYVQITDDIPDFYNFLDKFQVLRHFYTSKEAVQRITHEAIMDAAADNIRYIEIRFNPVALARVQNFPLSDVVTWVEQAAEQTQNESGVRTCLILQIGREEQDPQTAYDIVDLAIERFGTFVRGIDLAGNEVEYPDHERFTLQFERARKAGLRITAHAGEALGAESVHRALVSLKPERIGHGIHAVESDAVVQMLREQCTTLEVCPTSNVHTGAVSTMSQHPLYELFKRDVRVTLNTDDPSVSATTLTNEYVVAVKDIGLPQRLIYRMLRHSVDAAFIPDEEQKELLQNFREWLAPYPGAIEEFDAAYTNDVCVT